MFLSSRAARFGLVLGLVSLSPLPARAQYCRPPFVPQAQPPFGSTYLGNNVYVRRGIDTVSYYYWPGVPGTAPVLIRTVRVGQSVTSTVPSLPLAPGLPPATTVQTTTTQTTITTETFPTPSPPAPVCSSRASPSTLLPSCRLGRSFVPRSACRIVATTAEETGREAGEG